MAEVVHRNLEAMLPQLEELETSGIFSREEIRTIVKFRRSHEYRMVRRPAHKEDFLVAIQYELHLDRLRKQRKKRLGVTKSRRDADYGIQNRIHGLFRRVLKKFKGDLKLWMQYIDFAQKSRHKLSLSRIYGKALAIHPGAINLWVMAAKFQFEELKDVTSARFLLQQGLRANSTAQHLWREYVRLELMYADKIRKRQEILGVEREQEESEEKKGKGEGMMEEEDAPHDEFLTYKVASVAFQQAIKAIPDDVEFRLGFLEIHRLFPGTDSLQEEVYSSLKSDFPGHPLVWDALARRHWAGVDTSTLKASQLSELELQSEQVYSEGLSFVKSQSEVGGVASVKGGVESCGVGVVPSGGGAGPDANGAALWECYFKWAMERFQQPTSFKSIRKKAEQRLTTVFKEAACAGHFNTKTYQQLVSVLQTLNHHGDAKAVLGVALDIHPSSVQLWLLRLGVEMGVASTPAGVSLHDSKSRSKDGSSLKELESVCKEALKKIPAQDSLPVWQHWLEKTMGLSADDTSLTEDVFKRGIASKERHISEHLSGLYLEWAFKVGGVSKARKVYGKLLENLPVPYSLYEKCLELEELGLASGCGGCGQSGGGRLRRLRELYERAIRDYGKTQTEIWLKYIKAELTLEGGELEKVGRLHWKAVKELNPALVASFMEKYSLLYSTNI